jgi:hypothetical protein
MPRAKPARSTRRTADFAPHGGDGAADRGGIRDLAGSSAAPLRQRVHGGGAAARILAIGQFFSSAMGSVSNLLLMTGHERDFRNICPSARRSASWQLCRDRAFRRDGRRLGSCGIASS